MSLTDKFKGKKPNPPEPAQEEASPVESLTRLQVVERAGRALKLLLPLSALCDELSQVENLDRMTADARIRSDQAQAAHAELLAKHADELLTARARTEQEVATCKADVARMVAGGQQAVADAEVRARNIVASTEQTAKGILDKAQAEAAAIAAKVAELHAQAERLTADVEAKAAEVAAAEAKLAKVRKAASALLDS